MPNNPVQVVLNASNFIADADPAGGGANKDFFASRDAQFATHKAQLIGQVAQARAVLMSSGHTLGYAKVSMRPNAWAKSHRPQSAVFKPSLTPSVGVSDLGELLVEVTAESLTSVEQSIGSAEAQTRLGPGPGGREVPKPSRTRSEVGGIASIVTYGASDRRKFSAVDSSHWLADPRTGGYLLLQFFEVPTATASAPDSDAAANRRRAEYRAMVGRLVNLDASLQPFELSPWWTSAGFLALPMGAKKGQLTHEFHAAVLGILDEEPSIRKIWLPPISVPSTSVTVSTGSPTLVKAPDRDRTYPVIGIIDTGIAEVPTIRKWVVGRSALLDESLQDQHHGTFIGGLVADHGQLNSHPELHEDPCQIFDLGVHATDPVQAAEVYPNGFADFLQQLEFEIEASVAMGTRVFNMSLAIEEIVRDDSYSPFAARIDAIADRFDVIFVLPSGNLRSPQLRDPWPLTPGDVLPMLANYRYPGQDRIFQPSESVRSVTVGALDPALVAGDMVRPSIYTRRGPGVGLGQKPELSHIGGIGSIDSGLWSITTNGTAVQDCGTSFAAPIAAKTLANIDHQIEGRVRRETVVGLAIHSASVPAATAAPSLTNVSRDFVGFGVPRLARDTLITGDDAITLVFESALTTRKQLEFLFQWPQALVGLGGKCRGAAKLTLVYRPPLDLRFGSETVRVNLEAYLRQEKVDLLTGELSYEGFFKSKTPNVLERERVAHGQKWGAIKRWSRTSVRGVGTSSQWKLVVEPLARAGVQIPDEGIPFTAILTLRDPEGTAPVFTQMRQSLQASPAQISDIRTAQRIRPRT